MSSKWINVDDRLPKTHKKLGDVSKEVLVAIVNDEGDGEDSKPVICTGYFMKGEGWYTNTHNSCRSVGGEDARDYYDQQFRVTFWRPMVKAPKREKKKPSDQSCKSGETEWEREENMNRLTKHDKNGVPILPQENIQLAVAKLSALEDKKESGRLLETPSALGSHVWYIDCYYQDIGEGIVKGIYFDSHGENYIWIEATGGMSKSIPFDSFGKSFFRTRKEAEEKLKEEG